MNSNVRRGRRRTFFGVDLLLAVLGGIALGLAYAWVISPVEYVDADPSMLRPEFKDQFRAAIAASYAATGDLDRALARLGLLGDPDAAGALAAQAQQMLAAGADFSKIQQIAQLGADLQARPPVRPVVLPSATPSSAPLPTSTASVGMLTGTVTGTPVPAQTPTPRPSFTPTLTPGAGFVLVAQESLCESADAEPLLTVIVLDASGRQVPGAELIVTWDGGEDHFFTGLKPELGDGVADFEMAGDVNYAVRVGAGGAPVANVSAPPCAGTGGDSFAGDLVLTFRQP